VAAYDAQVGSERGLSRHLDGAESVIVVGNGGGAFWAAYRGFCAAHPGYDQRPDPLDDFTREVVEAAGGPLAPQTAMRILYPFGFAEDAVSFTRLAVRAGTREPRRRARASGLRTVDRPPRGHPGPGTAGSGATG
jgi:hypothetical protein